MDTIFSILLVDIEVPTLDTLHLLQQADAIEHEADIVDEAVGNMVKTEKKANHGYGIAHGELKSVSGEKDFVRFAALEQRRYLSNELQTINEFLFLDDWEEADTTDD